MHRQKAKCLLSWLPHNNTKRYYNAFAVSVELAYGQPLQDTSKNIRDQPLDGSVPYQPNSAPQKMLAGAPWR